MSGIAGVFQFQESDEELKPTVERMNQAQSFHGPEGGDCWIDLSTRSGLSCRRQRIGGPESGRQPFVSEDEGAAMVFSGRLYNHSALRHELESKGHRFKSDFNGEAALHLYEEEGKSGLSRLEGMFVFALIDRQRQGLLLVRDPLGIKPLYWARNGKGVVFASTAAALFASGLIRPEINPLGLLYFFQTTLIPAPVTAFAGVNRLESGSWLQIDDNGETHTQRYWQPEFTSSRHSFTAEQAVEGLKQILGDSVKEHLRTTHAPSLYLSGGVDSSLVVALACGARSGNSPLDAFTLAFPNHSSVNEVTHARRIAERLNCHHQVIEADTGSIPDLLPRTLRKLEEPCALPAPFLFLLSEAASSRQKNVLTGEGSDELFAGYPWLAENWGLRFRGIIPRSLARKFSARVTTPVWQLRFRQLASSSMVEAMAEGLGPFPYKELAALLPPEWHAGRDRYPPLHIPELSLKSARCMLERQLIFGMTIRLSEGVSFLGDKMAMAHGVEMRMPFLDRRVVEFALSLPANLKRKDGREKFVVNSLARQLVPEVCQRRKQGLRVPYEDYFSSQAGRLHVRELLLDGRQRGGLFIQRSLERWIDDLFDNNSRIPRPWLLWRLIVAQAWADEWLN